MAPVSRSEIIRYLSRFITEDRMRLYHEITEKRTRYITVVLEDIYQTQNASAVLRTCDCFGIQDVHIIENQNPFKVNAKVTLGSTKWLTLHRYNSGSDNTPGTLSLLKEQGYRIVATKPDPQAVSLNNFDLSSGKVALVFGSEKPGISSKVELLADEFLTIPMVGFTESLNISVSAAVILYQLTSKLRNSAIDWNLSPEEKEEILYNWLRKHIRHSHLMEKRFIEEIRSKKGK